MNAIAIDPRLVEWHNRKGHRVNLKFGTDGSIAESPWLPSFRPGALVTRGIGRSIKDLVVWASGKSQYYISKLLNQFWSATAYSFPATLYFAGWTASLTAASTGATAGEAAYTSYARVAVTANGTNFSTSAAGSSVTNSLPITWPASSGGGTSTWTFLAVLDSATLGAGNILYWGSITSAAVAVGDTPQIDTSGMTSTEA